ncbi:MAG: hypothetical protein GTO18_14410 [Anaerolineales bacterium]|nr:hypothetical protein [Anaerolineales bacterium]
MFRLVRAAVAQVMGTIMQQVNLIEEILSEVSGYGSVLEGSWIGDDADAFVSEINSRLIPQVRGAIASVGGMHVGIARAVEVIIAADRKARGMVRDLEDVFDGIF